MLELVKGFLVNPIQVSAEVNAALRDHSLVVVTKTKTANYDGLLYEIHACNGHLEAGHIVED